MSSITGTPARKATYLGLMRNWRFAFLVGMLAVAAAVLAAEAIDPILDPPAVDPASTEMSRGSGMESLTGVTSPDGVPDQAVVNLDAELKPHDPTVGKLAGEAATSGGAASYRIPIVVPPGRRGVQPDLALVYSSRGGNGIAGMGWSLSGLSAISRCPATLDQDGSNAAVQLTSSDRLCLDGQRLVAISGSYGQSGATYTTELASFARVTQLGGALSAAATYFKVETKDGDIAYYGGNSTTASAARVIPGGSTIPLTWLIERTQDRLGNLMRYAYTSIGNGETVLASILYTGFGTTDGNRHVDFTYATRPSTGGSNDLASSYVAGSLTLQTQRLTQIKTFVGNTAVRWYVLRYDGTSTYSGRSLLRGIKDCSYRTDGSTVACHPETTFGWQEGTLQSELHRFTVAGLPTGQEMSNLNPVGDLDGDGVQEMVAHYIDPTHATSGDNYLISLAADRSVKGVINTDTLGFVPSIRPVDFNKDGRADSVGFGSNALGVRLWNGSTTAFVPSAFSTYTLPLSIPLGACVAWNNNSNYPVIGDFNGDGFSDLAVATPASGTCAKAPGNSAWNLQIYLGKAGSSPGVPALNSTPAVTKALPYVTQADGAKLNFYPVAVTDFDGDGLADIQFERAQKDLVGGAIQEFVLPKMLWFSRNTGGTYSIGGTGNELNSFAAMASPGLEADETNIAAFTQVVDVNGDGLEDLVSIKSQGGAGYWSVRFNTGGHWGARIVTSNRRGIEFCPPTPDPNFDCSVVWRSMFAPLLSVADTDNDGRAEILAPRAFAMRICATNTSWVNGEPRDDTFCPENPLTGTVAATPPDPSERFHGFYVHGSAVNPLTVDGSAYYMDAIRFVQTGASAITATTINTPIILSGAMSSPNPGETLAFDMYGDGLGDFIGPIGAPVPPDTGGYPYYSVEAYVSSDPTWGPAALPDGTPASAFFHSWRNFISENPGASSTRNPDGLTPQIPDTLGLVTDGLGAQTGWTYYPLSSKAGRAVGDLPLYSVPGALASRYVDDRHFYFASSMPVVSDMFQTDDTGDVRSWRYGYSEAMYQSRGRGFQGFRTITEEDEAAGVRTATTYSQKFPLTSQIEQIATSALSRAYTDTNGIFKKQVFTWRCNRANRADATACVPPNGTATVVFPFLDEQQTITYDATVAGAASGTPAQLGYQRSVAADDSTCAGGLATASGYDANGNLLYSTVLTYDGNGSASGNGSGGTREFLGVHCIRTRSVYAAADTTNWWLDKLNSRSVTTAVTYNTTNHTLPAGVANPQQTVTTAYTWNTNRTPNTQTVQSGVANQQNLTAYGYPASNNYGLPTSVTVTASGDAAGPRQTSTTYSADGYFPATVTNPLSHQVSTSLRASDGQPTLVTDANGLRTLYQYDAFGFNTLTQFRGATDGDYVAPDRKSSLVWCATGGISCFQPGVYRVYVVQDGSSSTVNDFDALGHETGRAHRLMDGTWSGIYKQYDSAGRLTAESAPYRSGTTRYYTLYEGYDVAGRLLSKVSPRANQDGRGDMITTYSYAGRTTSIQVCGENDPNTSGCLNLARTTDSLGHYVETVDAAGGTTKFWYDGAGSALAIRDANGAIISATYNAIGQRTAVDDPNQGDWSFGYDALGELLSQTDARSITTTTSYDKLSRPLQRSATYDYDGSGGTEAVVDNWTYDPAYAKGSEATNTRKVNSTVLRSESASYDTLSRPKSRTLTQLRANNSTTDSVTQETAYDSYYGRPKAQSFGNAEVLWLQYSNYGDLTKESNPNAGKDYRVVDTVDGGGRPTQETWGNGNLTVTRTYLPQTGQVASIDYASLSNPALRTFDYAYDVFGNLVQQDLNGGTTRETYDYDAVQRLTEATRTGGASGTVDYAYDAIGNLTSKSDFSTTAANAYTYSSGSCGGGPNAVKSVALKAGGSRTYCYDAAGNMTGDNASLSVRYDHTQRPLQIARGTITQSFDYAPSGEKFRESGTDGEVAFFGNLERRYSPTAQDQLYTSNAIIIQTGSVRSGRYLLTDRLGSVDAITDTNGVIVESRGYDAFGKPRTGTWADATPPRLGTTANTPHGFTGHEHLNSLELIHMNGRVYDYNLGRFMEVDPIIQSPLNSQSLNPYSYIGNNPLSGTDPTGYFGELPCIMPTWACRQQVTGQGPDESFGFLATMAKLGLSQGGGNHNFSISNGTRRIMDNAAHTSNGAQVQITVGPFMAKGTELDSLQSSAHRASIEDITLTGSDVGQVANTSQDEITTLAIAANHAVGDPQFSLPNETRLAFDWRIRDLIAGYTKQSGNEYRSAFSYRPSPSDTMAMQYAAVIQTSDSPFASVATIWLNSDGWVHDPRGDEHSHGFIRAGHIYSKLDVAYLAKWTSISKAVGERAGLNDRGGIRDKFSPQDIGNGYSKLVTPNGLKVGSFGPDGQWTQYDEKRP